MKKIFNSLFIMAAFTAMFSASSCTKVCDEGFEGSDCKTEWRTKFLGTYAFADICPSGNYTGTASISVSSNNNVTILITNFGGIGAAAVVNGTLVESNKVTITSGTANQYTVNSASGTINNNIINWTYSLTDPSNQSESCTSTWTKQ